MSRRITPSGFALRRQSVPFAAATAKRVAAHVAALPDPPYTVLDIAAGSRPVWNRSG